MEETKYSKKAGGKIMKFNAILEKDEYGYFAYVPVLKDCVSQGDTFEEALQNIKDADKSHQAS